MQNEKIIGEKFTRLALYYRKVTLEKIKMESERLGRFNEKNYKSQSYFSDFYFIIP